MQLKILMGCLSGVKPQTRKDKSDRSVREWHQSDRRQFLRKNLDKN
ncbi:hypothetical protein ACE1CM_28465 [Microseira sp. BLCC-F43]